MQTYLELDLVGTYKFKSSNSIYIASLALTILYQSIINAIDVISVYTS